ncbi:hypothetical protein C8Q78DRAFT_962196, partial [Trametes maxima]
EQHNLDDFKTEYHPRMKRPPLIQHFEDFKRGNKPVDPSKLRRDPWKPWSTRLDFEVAEFALGASLSRSQVTILLGLFDRVAADRSKLTFKTYDDIKAGWEAASKMFPAFEKHEVSAPLRNDVKTYTFYCRPLWDWALSLVADRVLAPHFVWSAIRLFKWNGLRWVRFVDEPFTANYWWDIETLLPPNGFPLCFILYADKTHLSSFGTQKGYPIMARIANLPSNIRNAHGWGGGQVVGLLPIVEGENERGKLSYTTHKRAVWHESFWILLKVFAKMGKLGELFKCGDDITRLLFPIILILAADYEEQSVMALIRGLLGNAPCPVCLVKKGELSTLGAEPLHPLRTVEESRSLFEKSLSLSKEAAEALLKPVGLRPIENVFWKIPYCDPYKALSFDQLHAYDGGLFSDHLFKEFQEIVAEAPRAVKIQINTQCDAVPRWRRLNHFSEICEVTLTDGVKYDHISKYLVVVSYNVISYLPGIQGKRGYQLMKCTRKYNVLNMYASMKAYTEDRKAKHQGHLPQWSHEAHEYTEVHPKNWEFPKAHGHEHTPTDMWNKGRTDTYDSKIFEPLHRPLKKIYLERTNFKEIEGQLANIDHHFFLARYVWSYLDILDEADEDDSEEKEPKENKYQFAHFYLGSRETKTLGSIEEEHSNDPGFVRFRLRFHEHLLRSIPAVTLTNQPHQFRLRPEDTIIISKFMKVDYESMDDWKLATDYLRCNPMFHGSARYDHVIFKMDDNDFRFAKLKVILIYEYNDIRYPIAFVETFGVVRGPRRRVDQDLGLCRIRPSRVDPHAPADNTGSGRTAFIPVESIIRGALIVADHGTPGDYLVVDTIDTDMFLRIQEFFPFWQ